MTLSATLRRRLWPLHAGCRPTCCLRSPLAGRSHAYHTPTSPKHRWPPLPSRYLTTWPLSTGPPSGVVAAVALPSLYARMEHSCICHGHRGAESVTEAGAHAADGAGGGAAALQGPPRGCSVRSCLPVRQVYSCCARRRKRSSIRRPHSICLADALKTAHSQSCAASEHAACDVCSPPLPRRMVSW